VREYKDLRDKEATIKDLLRQMKRLEPEKGVGADKHSTFSQ
jgi:hypothetical protein